MAVPPCLSKGLGLDLQRDITLPMTHHAKTTGQGEHSDLLESLRIERAGGTTNFMKFHAIGSNEEETRRLEKQVAQVSTCAVLVVLLF